MFFCRLNLCLLVIKRLSLMKHSSGQKQVIWWISLWMIQGRPIPVVSGVIIPINRLITTVSHLVSAIHRGPITPLITIDLQCYKQKPHEFGRTVGWKTRTLFGGYWYRLERNSLPIHSIGDSWMNTHHCCGWYVRCRRSTSHSTRKARELPNVKTRRVQCAPQVWYFRLPGSSVNRSQ